MYTELFQVVEQICRLGYFRNPCLKKELLIFMDGTIVTLVRKQTLPQELGVRTWLSSMGCSYLTPGMIFCHLSFHGVGTAKVSQKWLGCAQLCVVSPSHTHTDLTPNTYWQKRHKNIRKDLKHQTSGPPVSEDNSRRSYLRRAYKHGHLPGPLPHSGLEPRPVILVSVYGPVTMSSSKPFLTPWTLPLQLPMAAREVSACYYWSMATNNMVPFFVPF